MGHQPEPFAADLLRASAPGLASLAAARLLPRLDPTSPPLGAPPDRAWREHLAGRLADLAQALEEGRGRVFLDQVAWARIAFASREMNGADLASSLDCLRQVLSDELPESATGGAIGLIESALETFGQEPPAVPAVLSVDDEHGRLAAGYLVALLEGDRVRATRMVLEPVRAGTLAVRDALLGVCQPAQRELGRMWHLNEITVAEEHFVSATTVRLMSQLMAFAPQTESVGKTVLAASVGLDEHDIGLRLVSELFELDGWRVEFLGARLPVGQLAWAARELAPDLVLLSAAMDSHREGVAAAVAALRDTDPQVRVIVGGPAFDQDPESWRVTGADAGGCGADDAVAVGRRLVGLDAG